MIRIHARSALAALGFTLSAAMQVAACGGDENAAPVATGTGGTGHGGAGTGGKGTGGATGGAGGTTSTEPVVVVDGGLPPDPAYEGVDQIGRAHV